MMKKIKFKSLFLLLMLVTGCSSGLVSHGFHFDAGWESPNIQILDYRYGSSGHPGASAS